MPGGYFQQWRIIFGTQLSAKLTSSRKTATGFGVYRADYFTLNDLNFFVAHRDIRFWNGGKQCLRVRMKRTLK